MSTQPVAVVTGASSGIGAATAKHLAAAGFHVVLGARRTDRIEALAKEIGGTARTLDVTDQASVDAFCGALDRVHVLVNNAGGAFGADHVSVAKADEWQAMYDVNVIGVLRMTQALIPKLIDSGAGTILIVGSTAAHVVYEGGAGYTAAKHGVFAVAGTLRLELNGKPVRVIEVDPGMVKTDEFAINRMHGDADKAAAVYAGVAQPLTADDIADAITWCITRPHHVNIDQLRIQPLAQAAAYKVDRRL